VLTSGRADPKRLEILRRRAVVRICGKSEIDFHQALRWLREEWDIRRLLCEGGGEVNDALFRAGLVNELHLTICPKIFGGRGAPTLAEGVGQLKLANAATLALKASRRYDDELFLVYRVKS
jgi:riboflavin biosynthesis pyrimidine reductase